MKKILLTTLIIGLLSPSLSIAEKGDTEIRFDTKMCMSVRYTCDTNNQGIKRYGWSYYQNEKGCGCIQKLSNKQITTINNKIKNLIVAIDTVFPEKDEKYALLKRIKAYLGKNYQDSEVKSLYRDIILGKLHEAYGDF